MWPPFCLTTFCKRTSIFWPPNEARKCSAAQGPHSEVVPCAFWRLVSKSCDECKGSFARVCEAKRWSHWTCSSVGTIFQPVRINSVPDVKCFCSNKNVLRAQSMVWHFVSHPVCCNTLLHFISYDNLEQVNYTVMTGLSYCFIPHVIFVYIIMTTLV